LLAIRNAIAINRDKFQCVIEINAQCAKVLDSPFVK
jgi:hypothetical protein